MEQNMATVSKREWTYKGEKKSAWTVRYVDQSGRQRQQTFERKKDADAARAKVEIELQRGSHIAAAQTITVKQLAEHYMDAMKVRREAGRRMGDSHYRTLTFAFRKHIVPHLGRHRLIDLNWAIVDEWARKISTGGDLSAQSAKRMMHILKVAIDFAIRREWTHRNIVEQVMKEYRGGERKPIRTFSVDQVRAVLAASGDRPPGHTHRAIHLIRCYVHIAVFAGLRFGEIGGLTVENVDFEAGIIKVRHNLTDVDLLKGPKTKAGIRDVPMAEAVADMLKAWIRKYYIPNDRGLIFRAPTGKMISPQTFHRNHWHRCLTRAGLAPDENGDWHHFHALRHFCASAMIDAGISMPEVAALLGHSAFDMTLQVYAHTIAGGQKRNETLQNLASGLLGDVQELRMAAIIPQNQMLIHAPQ